MSVPGSYLEVIARYKKCPKEIRKYFEYLPGLLSGFPLDVSIAYMFSRVEFAHNMTLYCVIAKKHRVNSVLTWQAISSQYITRRGFSKFLNTVGVRINKNTISKIKETEKIRDTIMHGSIVSENSKRRAIVDILNYAEIFNSDVHEIAGFKPFGALTGHPGRREVLDKATSRWVLKGIGFDSFQ